MSVQALAELISRFVLLGEHRFCSFRCVLPHHSVGDGDLAGSPYHIFACSDEREHPTFFLAFVDEVAEQLRDAIKALMLKGLPAEVIKSWVDENVTLSRLRITRHFKIILADYDMEIKMGPLPKAVFLFYLRHPEGVRFSYLQDYADELMHIYSRLSVNDDPKKMRESINALTDPLSNSASEKCAAIKKAFLLQINDSIAKNYYVTGVQGGKKGISLDRSLVQWECKL